MPDTLTPPSQTPPSETPASPSDHAPLLERAFPDVVPEDAYTLEVSEGEQPEGLSGTYYLNGPARFGRGAQRYDHWLDGDGMVAALRLEEGTAHLTHRFVRSHKFVEEEAAGRAIYRAFGTAFDGDTLYRGMALASPINVSVYPYRDSLLAFGEQGLPWELDPSTLETRGEYSFDGRLNTISPFSAHPCFDTKTGEMFNFGVSFAADKPTLNLYRFGTDGELVYRRRQRLPWPCSVHDFVLSERFAIFHLSPYLLDMKAFVDGDAHLLDALRWRPELGTALWIFSRETGQLLHQVPIGNRYCLHLVHAAESQARVEVDVIEMNEPVYDQYAVPDLFPEPRTATVTRYGIDAVSGRLLATTPLEVNLMCDFPALDPRTGLGGYDAFWLLAIAATHEPGRKFFDRVLRAEWSQGGTVDSYAARPGCYFGGEPVFLPDPASEHGGFTLVQEFDATNESMRFLLLDAHDLASGPIVAWSLRRPIHLGFHTCWHAT